MIASELNKFEKFIDHSVEVGNITNKASLDLIRIFSQNNLDENYDIIDQVIQNDIQGISYDDLGEFLHEYHIYQENLHQLEREKPIPTLEHKNFSVQDMTYRNHTETADGTSVLENPERDIIAFIDGPYEDQQLFKPEALLRELKKVGKKLPASPEIYKKIIEERYNGNYSDFFKKEGLKKYLSGCLSVSSNTITGMGEDYYLLCANGEFFCGNKYFGEKRKNGDYYISGRCIK